MCCKRHLDKCTDDVVDKKGIFHVDVCSDDDACLDLESPADVLARRLSHPFKGSQSMCLVKTPAARGTWTSVQTMLLIRKASSTLMCARTSASV